MLIHRARKEPIKYPIEVESIDNGGIIGDNPNGKECILPIKSERLKDKPINDIVKRFDMKPLKPIPINELTNEEVEDSDKKFISRLIDIFKGIQNKG